MRLKLRTYLLKALQWLRDPPPNQQRTIDRLSEALVDLSRQYNPDRLRYMEQITELVEARQMAGAGPWTCSPVTLAQTDRVIREALDRFGRDAPIRTRESNIVTQGIYGDIELMLQNVEWRRDLNVSWLEFSRWGIQSIILITRLNYLKNPIIRRLIDVTAQYTFARGFELSCKDPDGNAVLQDFLSRNRRTLGHVALVDLQRRKGYDGNIFHVLFTDKNTGLVRHRTIDATEIQEIRTDPEDSDTPWFYKRQWQQVAGEGSVTGQAAGNQSAWYPAIDYDPDVKPTTLDGIDVRWDSPIHHRKSGGIAKWKFGVPELYPALAYAREAKSYLERCASVAAALGEIARTVTTKGGQVAVQGVKNQLETQVNTTGASLWDPNPPAVAGSTFASGPGTQIAAFKTQGAGLDPEGVRRYLLMACMVVGVPETFLGDVSTGNLATATSLDRPTEAVILEKQESWREDMVVLGTYVLKVSDRAPAGKLREALNHRGILEPGVVRITEAPRVKRPSGTGYMYLTESKRQAKDDTLEVMAEFPTIREGDQLARIKGIVSAATLDNKAGQVIGIDEKVMAAALYRACDIDGGDELAEQQYPSQSGVDVNGNKFDAYDPNRMTEIIPPPIEKPKPQAGGAPQIAPNDVPDEPGYEHNSAPPNVQ